jgi:hypothetical protein
VTTPENAPQDAEWYSPAQLESIVKAFMQRERETHSTEISQLKAQVEALGKSLSGTVPTMIPEHGAGAGLEVHATWSKYEQELQNAAREAKAIAMAGEAVAAMALPFIPGLL